MGSNKALLRVDGITFIERILNTLQQRFSQIYISANKPDEYTFLNRPIISDIFVDYGPLAGIHAVLKTISTDYLLTVSCDVPFLSTYVIDVLIDHVEPNVVVIADDGTQSHQLIGVYPRSVCNTLDDCLQTGERQVKRFLEKVNCRSVDISRFSYAVKNINTVEDYKKEISYR
jgi:molybdenum cofactor guanylyltransferase